ncbi:MAG: M23 family metallopeptidase [Acidobacteria bacterium]|nr:M23 family metallopeptidase [Acidobacteriota bacterium]
MRRRALRRGLALTAVALVGVFALLPSVGSAQVPPLPIESPKPTTSPTPPPPPPPPPPPEPNPEPNPEPTPEPTPTRTRTPSPRPQPSAKPTTPPPTRDGGGSGGSRARGSTTPRGSARGGPDVYQGRIADAINAWASRERTPAHSTARLLDLLARLDPLGAPSPRDMVRGFGRFPVAGYVWYQDDWAAPRYKPYFHLHEGTDLFAQSGTPAIATVDGVVSRIANGTIGGLSVWLDGVDGVTYYYGHLQGFGPGVRPGLRVRTGDVLGFVGDTGTAKGTYPHVHFEVHPLSGPPINPKPFLDRWLAAAEGAVETSVMARNGGVPSDLSPARWDTLLGLLGEFPDLQPALWPSVLDPAGASADFADFMLGSLVATVDWDGAVPSGEVVGADAEEWEGAAPGAADPLGLYG